MKKSFIAASYFIFLVLSLVSLSTFSQQGELIYQPGMSGYSCFRIPAILSTQKGIILAFAEGRKDHCGDAGNIDLVLRRSEDGGRTWSPLQIVWSDSSNTCGNPAPVLDRKTGKILLLSTWNLGSDHEPQIISGKSKDTRRIFVLSSDDEGFSWSSPREITSDVKQPGWTWYATGPCNGIQLQKGPKRGRLVIPCDHIEAGTKKYYSHAIYSDDGGQHWKLGGTTPSDQVNESTVAELPGGKLLLNMRNYTSVRVRQVAESEDGGESWSALRGDTALVEPVCQGSLVRSYGRGKKGYLAFSNPADAKSRIRMTARKSYDWGKTWTSGVVLHEGPSAYSNLVVLPGGGLGCLYEGGIKTAYEGIRFTLLPG